MEQLKNLTSRQMSRLIGLALIVLYLLYGVWSYAWEVRVQMPQIDYVDNMQIDGSEFAPIANLFVGGANGLMAGVTMGLSAAAMFVIALFLMILWRCIALRRSSVVTEIEWKITKYLVIGYIVLAVVGGWMLLGFTNLLFVLWLAGAPLLSVWPLGMCSMKNAYLRQSMREEN